MKAFVKRAQQIGAELARDFADADYVLILKPKDEANGAHIILMGNCCTGCSHVLLKAATEHIEADGVRLVSETLQ